MQKIINELKSNPDYAFLKNNENLGNSIILLAVAGSYSYGINTKNSDLDIRGCAMNSKREILLNRDFEQYNSNQTDTVIYSFYKLIKLLTQGSPNTIEILGLNPEHYLYIHPYGQEILDNKHLFLSKQLIKKYEGFIKAQTKKIERKTSLNEDCNKIIANVLRLYYTAIELFETTEIRTYRIKEKEFLLQIREGKITLIEVGRELERLRKKFIEAAENTKLPDEPDYRGIDDLVCKIVERKMKESP